MPISNTRRLLPEASTPNGDETVVSEILMEQHQALLPLVTDLCEQKRNQKITLEDEYSFHFNLEDGEKLVHGVSRLLDMLETMSIREKVRAIRAAA